MDAPFDFEARISRVLEKRFAWAGKEKANENPRASITTPLLIANAKRP
jgi:hypothetical protein